MYYPPQSKLISTGSWTRFRSYSSTDMERLKNNFNLFGPAKRLWAARPRPTHAISLPNHAFIRGKRTTKLAPGARRIINMLSVLSARKKQPRRLKMCKEDLIRHKTIQSAWKIFLRDENAVRMARLEAQHRKIAEACETLKDIDAGLFAAATAREVGKRFPMELRVPTDTPPREPWPSTWTPHKP